MRAISRLLIPISSLVVGLYLGFILFGAVAHENSHALVCLFFGLPYRYSLSQITYYTPNASQITQIIVGASGGIGQALSSLVFFGEVTFLENRNAKWFLSAFGFEIAFLTIAFMGIVNSIWEGFFHDNYDKYYNNAIIFTVLAVSMMGLSAYVVNRWKGKRLNAKLVAECI